MSYWIAQRGTKVTVIEADSLRAAAVQAAVRLRLDRARPRRWFVSDLATDENCEFMRGENGELTYVRRRVGPGDDFCPTPKWSRWPRDWRGRAASIRRATPTEVVLWEAAQEQVEELRPLTKSALRDLIRGHEQGTLA